VFNEESVVSDSNETNDTGDYPYKQELLLLWQFATKLKEARGKPDGNRMFPDYNFTVADEHVTIEERNRDTPIDRVVSELMIHVNSQWGKVLAEATISAIYRTQDNGKVRMSTAPAPHQGLGVAHYMWSSSPLRRYIDFINQRQLLACLRVRSHLIRCVSEKLFGTIRDFELAYEAYNNIQRHMERYWCLRWLIQENISTSGAVVVKENLVKLEPCAIVYPGAVAASRSFARHTGQRGGFGYRPAGCGFRLPLCFAPVSAGGLTKRRNRTESVAAKAIFRVQSGCR